MDPNNEDKLNSIRSYYDHNTLRFLSYGAQRGTRTIHRAVWGEGVENEEHALHYVHNLIINEIRSNLQNEAAHINVLDLGCGVGASLIYLAQHLAEGFSGVGITISPVQVKIAQREQRTGAQFKKCLFVLGDILMPPLQMKFDLIYAIESFAHIVKPGDFFQTVARMLKPGGLLVICDDFFSDDREMKSLSVRVQKWLHIFGTGWGIDGLWQPGYLETLAADVGFARIVNKNLTHFLRLKPLPSIVIELLSTAVKLIPGDNLYLPSVIGGQALQLCLTIGILEYRYLVYKNNPGVEH